MGVPIHQGGNVQILVIAVLPHLEGLDVPVLDLEGQLGASEHFEDFDEHADFNGVLFGDVHATRELLVEEVFLVLGELSEKGLEMLDAAVKVELLVKGTEFTKAGEEVPAVLLFASCVLLHGFVLTEVKAFSRGDFKADGVLKVFV